MALRLPQWPIFRGHFVDESTVDSILSTQYACSFR